MDEKGWTSAEDPWKKLLEEVEEPEGHTYHRVAELLNHYAVQAHALTVFRDVRLTDLVFDRGDLPVRPPDDCILRFVICEGPHVILVSEPNAESRWGRRDVLFNTLRNTPESDMEMDLAMWERMHAEGSWNWEGFPFGTLPTSPAGNEELDLALWERSRPKPRWRYDPLPIDRRDWPLLAARGLVEASRGLPTRYGMERGVAERYWLGPGGMPQRELCCSAEAWLKLWEPWEPRKAVEPAPDREPPRLSLDERLAAQDNGISVELRCYGAELERLMRMPMRFFLADVPYGMSELKQLVEDTGGAGERAWDTLTFMDVLRRIDQLERRQAYVFLHVILANVFANRHMRTGE